MKKIALVSIIAGVLSASAAWAHDNPGTTCPAATQAAIDLEFGAAADGTLTSQMTECLVKREHIRAAINVSSNALNAKNGYSQQLNNISNMIGNYEGIYGLQLGRDGYQIVAIVHGAAGKFLLNGTKYAALYNGEVNKTEELITKLIAKGIPVYMCQNTMRVNGWVTADLIPGVQEVPGGVTAAVDFGLRGWMVLTP